MLGHLIERAEEHRKNKQDYGPSPVATYEFDRSTCHLKLPLSLDSLFNNGTSYTTLPLTDHALRQVCGRLGPAAYDSSRTLPFDYIKACPPYLRAKNLNHWIPQMPEQREWFVRVYGETVRAVLTNRYSVVDCLEVLKWVQQIIDEDGGEFDMTRSYLTPDALTLDLLKNTINTGSGGGTYATGLRVITGEIGNRRIAVMPLVQRTSCTNSITWLKDGAWEHPHTGNTRVLRQELLIHMVHALEGTEQLLGALLDAHNQDLPKFDEILNDICERRGWGQEVHDNVIRGSEQSNTVWGLVNGITYAAQHLDNQEDQDDMELLAGEFLYAMTRKNVLAERA